MNALQLYSGRPLKLAENVYVEHPKVNKLLNNIGGKDAYSEYMKNLALITTQSKDIADILWVENKIWYEDIKSEYEFFIQECLADSTSNNVFIRDGEVVSEMDDECVVINNDMSNALNYFLNLDGKWIVLGRTVGGNTQNGSPNNGSGSITVNGQNGQNVNNGDNPSVSIPVTGGTDTTFVCLFGLLILSAGIIIVAKNRKKEA